MLRLLMPPNADDEVMKHHETKKNKSRTSKVAMPDRGENFHHGTRLALGDASARRPRVRRETCAAMGRS
ncbi:MAG: hypothetical protein AAF830_02490 [Pseudomonadota bacterium]